MLEMKKCALGDLITFQRGHDLPKANMAGEGYPVVGSNGIIGYHNKYTMQGPVITIGRSGNVGNPHICYGPAWAHNTTLYVKEYKESDPEFIYYFLKTLDLGHYAGGSAVPTLNRNHIHTIPISVPTKIEDQRRVVLALKLLDAKIDVNNEINENLLQQAGAVFDKFYNASPDQQPFTSLINVLGGGTPKTGNPEFWDGSIPFFTPKDVGAPYTFQTEKYITESGLAHCNSRLYQKDTTFVTARGTVGKVSLAGTPMAMNQSCYALASETADPLLVYFYVLRAVASLKHKASGAVFDAIVTRDFDSETINILSDDDSKLVLSIIRPIMDAIHNNSEENMLLVELRDSLLPKLMSGELDISELDI